MRVSKLWSAFAAAVLCSFLLGTAAPAAAKKVAVVSAELPERLADVIGKLQSTGQFSGVDQFDANSGTPSLAWLLGYDAVLVHSDTMFQDPTAIGNVLADYVDQGGGVVVATFALASTSGLGVSGRLLSGGYLPMTQGPYAYTPSLTMTVNQPGHPLMSNVATFLIGTGGYHVQNALAGGATLVASWSAGYPLVAYKPSPRGTVVALNFFPPSSDVDTGGWVSSTDGEWLMGNALLYAGANASVPATLVVTDTNVGTNCDAYGNGGQRIRTGLDNGDGGGTARNNTLEDGEVDQTTYVCNGADGANGADGFNSITVVDTTVDTNCDAYGNGGQRIRQGLDNGDGGGTARNNTLEAGEVDSTAYICNGADGADGTPGVSSIIVTDTTVDTACDAYGNGGQRIRTGLDNGDGGGTAGNGTLEAGEVDSTVYVCNGANGSDGQDGANGANALVTVTAEPAGANCANGGQRIDVGVDDNGNGTLDSAEIDDTAYICNGADGADGADGANGANGANGADGADGTDGANGANGATGATGPTGPAGPAGADGKNGGCSASGSSAGLLSSLLLLGCLALIRRRR